MINVCERCLRDSPFSGLIHTGWCESLTNAGIKSVIRRLPEFEANRYAESYKTQLEIFQPPLDVRRCKRCFRVQYGDRSRPFGHSDYCDKEIKMFGGEKLELGFIAPDTMSLVFKDPDPRQKNYESLALKTDVLTKGNTTMNEADVALLKNAISGAYKPMPGDVFRVELRGTDRSYREALFRCIAVDNGAVVGKQLHGLFTTNSQPRIFLLTDFSFYPAEKLWLAIEREMTTQPATGAKESA